VRDLTLITGGMSLRVHSARLCRAPLALGEGVTSARPHLIMNYNEYITWWLEKRHGLIVDTKMVYCHIEPIKEVWYIRVGKKKKRPYNVNVWSVERAFLVVKTI